MDLSISSHFRPVSLMYHDVVEDGAWDSSGFPGAAGAHYKLEAAAFRRHMDAVARAAGNRIAGAIVNARVRSLDRPVLLTFDDGGSSFDSLIAPELESRGWRGHFFVTTDFIGRPGFLDANAIRRLHIRGHVVGTHSSSHPQRISRWAFDEVVREWAVSARTLAEIFGEPVVTGSVPGGFYTETVARAAAEAGIGILFTSEPTRRPRWVAGCLVLGRYGIRRQTTPEHAAALVEGRIMPRAGEKAFWKIKKIAKAAGGDLWFRARERFLTAANPETRPRAS